MVYPALLPLMRTPRLPVVHWTDTPADLNGLVRLGERQNLVSARVPSGSARALQLNRVIEVLGPAIHSWLLIAALLSCWRLTGQTLCWICAGVYRYCATDRKGNTLVVSVAAEGYFNHRPNSQNQTSNCSNCCTNVRHNAIHCSSNAIDNRTGAIYEAKVAKEAV